MSKKKNSSLVDALKEYNKALADQITKIKSFIEDVDKHIHQFNELHQQNRKSDIPIPFSRDYLLYKAKNNIN